jgi:hypothetical protein
MGKRHWLGFWAAMVSFAAASGYSVAQIMQVLGLLKFPLDEIMIFGFSIFIATPFVIAIAALHYAVPAEKRVWTHTAATLAAMYATLVSLVYMTELFVTVPARMNGAAAQVAAITLSEHSFFWAIDALGYVLMSIAALLAAGALSWRGLQGWLKLFLVLHGLQAPVIVLIMWHPDLLLWGSGWMLTGPGMMMLMAIYFLRTLVVEKQS